MQKKKKKKIIYVITKSFWGGAQRYVYDLATALPKGEFKGMVAAGAGPFLDCLKKKGVKTITVKNFARDVNIFHEFFAFFELIKIFKKEKPNIVHLNSSKAGGIGAVAAKIAGVQKIIFTAHGWAFNEKRPVWQKLLIKFFVWLSILFQDKVIAVSEKTKQDVKNFPFISKKIQVIYNGIKPFDLSEREEVRKKIIGKSLTKISEDTVLVSTISELHKNKGLEYAIQAVSILRDLPIILIIIGKGEMEKNLKSQISNLKLESKVFLLGEINNAKKYLKAFDIFLLPSVTEALPYAILEAGQAGLPVIASSVGGVPEIVKDGEDGILFEPKNPAEISSAIRKLALSPELRNNLGRNLKKTVGIKFSFNRMLQETLNLY